MVGFGYSHSQRRRIHQYMTFVHPPHTHSQSMYPRRYIKLSVSDLVVLGLGVLGLDMGIGYG